MLDLNDIEVAKKGLYPLIISFVGSLFTYTVAAKMEDEWGFLLPLMILVVVIFLGYALKNIWELVDEKKKIKLYTYLAGFAVFFHATSLTIDHFFQGIIALVWGLFILYVFFKWLTVK